MAGKTLGKVVLDTRTARGWTQRQLAARLGVRASHIAYIENAQRLPSLRLMGRMARVFKLDPLTLLKLAHPETRAWLR